ncbi:MAG: hypothetical protein QM791_02330 [Ferruginibacter sp.]
MKKKLLFPVVFLAALTILHSCYKSGEVIYQPVCKTVQLQMENFNYLLSSPVLWGQRPNNSFNYTTGNSRRLLTAAALGQPYPYYHNFVYDANNNLVRINRFSGNTPDKYFVLGYPDGTRNSASNEITVYEFTADDILTYTYKLEYNSEYQLTAVYNENRLLFAYEYDFGGNCTKATGYSSDGTVRSTLEFISYDNKTNPGRTDRPMQIFINDYSKNNCTKSIASRYSVDPVTGATTVIKDTVISNWQYNNDLPVYRNSSPYATYDCNIITGK